MAKDNNQGRQQKPQSNESKKLNINKSANKESKRDNAGDTTTTGSTGPRKK